MIHKLQCVFLCVCFTVRVCAVCVCLYEEDDKHKVNYHSNGVGVYNVQKRLKLYYGDDYGGSCGKDIQAFNNMSKNDGNKTT